MAADSISKIICSPFPSRYMTNKFIHFCPRNLCKLSFIMATNFTVNEINVTIDVTTSILLSPTLVATVQLLLSIFGIAAYIIFLFIVFRNKLQLLKSSFWILTLHLAVPDCFYLLVSIIYTTPCIYIQKQVYGNFVGQAFANMSTLFFYTLFFIMVFISLDRFVKVVVRGSLAAKLDSQIVMHSSAVISWLFAIIMVTVTNLNGCNKEYHENYYRYLLTCPWKELIFIIACITYGFTILIAVLYLIILIYVRAKRKEVNEWKWKFILLKLYITHYIIHYITLYIIQIINYTERNTNLFTDRYFENFKPKKTRTTIGCTVLFLLHFSYSSRRRVSNCRSLENSDRIYRICHNY